MLSVALALEYEAICHMAEHRLAAGLSAVETAIHFIADTFSATAITTNWSMLAPSWRLSFSTAAFRETGKRKGDGGVRATRRAG
jgi:hypothetical protein